MTIKSLLQSNVKTIGFNKLPLVTEIFTTIMRVLESTGKG